MVKQAMQVLATIALLAGLAFVAYPTSFKVNNDSIQISCSKSFGSQMCVAQFDNEVHGIDQYKGLINILKTMTSWDTIVLHLQGNGGDADAAATIISAMKECKGTVDTSVDGDVYSADAMLSVAGDIIYIRPGVLFLFHRADLGQPVEKVCEQFKGTLDRGQDMYTKCVTFLNTQMNTLNAYLYQMMAPALTPEELVRVQQGFDVLVTGDQIAVRLHVGANK